MVPAIYRPSYRGHELDPGKVEQVCMTRRRKGASTEQLCQHTGFAVGEAHRPDIQNACPIKMNLDLMTLNIHKAYHLDIQNACPINMNLDLMMLYVREAYRLDIQNAHLVRMNLELATLNVR